MCIRDRIKAGRVRKVICSFPKASHSWVFDDLYRRGGIELECVPQGTIAERLRAAGAGLGGFFTPKMCIRDSLGRARVGKADVHIIGQKGIAKTTSAVHRVSLVVLRRLGPAAARRPDLA